jgi:D-glycero-D-manno-heptose 1,7-bisphosphate phosphatase
MMRVAPSQLRPAVFLDRDGVINRVTLCRGDPHPPASLGDLVILPGVARALSTLKARGFALIVVTNQPDVARGTASAASVASIHTQLAESLEIDAIFSCFHDDRDACDCRKPKPGLLLQAAEAFGIDLRSSFMVGDRWRDIEAGRQAGCRTFWVEGDYRERQAVAYDFRVRTLSEAAAAILAQATPR